MPNGRTAALWQSGKRRKRKNKQDKSILGLVPESPSHMIKIIGLRPYVHKDYNLLTEQLRDHEG